MLFAMFCKFIFYLKIFFNNFSILSLRLSGLSPFMDETDVDTFANITRADFDFDDEAFDQVSQEAKDFISNLLVHRKEDRLTAKECLISKWLSQLNENMSKIKICTDKLKKFIIRRKWQVCSFTLLLYIYLKAFNI